MSEWFLDKQRNVSDHFPASWQNPPSHAIFSPQKQHCVSSSVLPLFNQISDLDVMSPICCYWLPTS